MKRKISPTKKSIEVPLFIVEGYTEENYIKILKIIYQKNVSILNCKGGGANSVLLKSDKIINEEADYYSSFVIIYDADTDNPKYDNLRTKIITSKNVNVIILDPCFENWLLLHISQKKVEKTNKCDKCIAKLKKSIPNYEKDDFQLLGKYVKSETFNQACKNQPEIGNILKKYFF